ncbi:MAG: hypothetical protein HC862_07500 [Scytonema sp. RU_4_4]|nr:hypothetical protein [Scytonema sp. RU_4_4]NJR75638.1 hypothetical protein [Scytonema sp. CRU_2_7]
MSTADIHLHRPKNMFFTQSIVLAILSSSMLGILYFLLFSTRIPGVLGIEKHADWYVVGTYIFEAIAYLGAGVLCLRNWRSPQIASSHIVWLVISIGMLLYSLGQIFVSYTEITLKEEPIVFLGDLFLGNTYLFLGMGILWFQYATKWIHNYQIGKILEVFWVWNGVLFDMDAVLEYDASFIRLRRVSRRTRT